MISLKDKTLKSNRLKYHLLNDNDKARLFEL